MKKKGVSVLLAGISLVILLLALPMMAACGAEEPTTPETPTTPTAPTEQIKWRHSFTGQTRGFSQPIEWMYDEIYLRTNGGWKIDIYWGAVLSPAKEAVYGIRDGLFEAGYASAHEGIMPLQAFCKNSMVFGPRTVGPENPLFAIEKDLHPLIIAETAKYNCRPWMPTSVPGRQMYSMKQIECVEDLDGELVRDDIPAGKIWQHFGATIVEMPIWEVGENAQRGIVTAAYGGFPTAVASSGFGVFNYVGDHAGLSTCGMTSQLANVDAFEALPQEYQDIYWDLLLNEFPQKFAEINESYLAEYLEEWLERSGEAGTGGIIVHQPDECWGDPWTEGLLDIRFPELIADLEAKGIDANSWIQFLIDAHEKLNVPLADVVKERYG
jgi:TRAP-type C4-dicarboxylate transport system substrate-binding protein